MADRPNTPIPEESEAIMLRAEEQAVALAASKLTRPTTRLANDVLLLIATRGTAKDLGKAQVVSRGWQAAARREVTLRTGGRVLNVFSEKPAYLRSIEILDAVVGPKPAGSWRDRWPELQYAKFLRVDELLALHAPDAVIQLFRDNIHVIDAELAKIRESIEWKVESGWPRRLAEDYTLIMCAVRVFTDGRTHWLVRAQDPFQGGARGLRCTGVEGLRRGRSPTARRVDTTGAAGGRGARRVYRSGRHVRHEDERLGVGRADAGRRAGRFLRDARAPRGERAPPLPLGRRVFGRRRSQYGDRLRADQCGNQPVRRVPTILHQVISRRWHGRAGSVER